MRSLKSILVAALLIGGCFRSLQPVYTPEQLVFDPALLGKWRAGSETWTITSAGAKAYGILQTDTDGTSGVFLGHLVEVDGHRFIDLIPVKPASRASGLHSGAYQPMHMVAMVVRSTPTPQFALLRGEWLSEHLARDPDDLRHMRIGNDVIITASTRKIQAFLVRHLETPNAFLIEAPWERGS